MNKLAIVIKTAEGAVINENDLCQTINEGIIAGTAIDGLSSEPPAQDHLYLKFLSRPNFILTPHVAWASTEAMRLWRINRSITLKTMPMANRAMRSHD